MIVEDMIKEVDILDKRAQDLLKEHAILLAKMRELQKEKLQISNRIVFLKGELIATKT